VLRQRGLPTALARHRGLTDACDLVLPVPVPVRGPSGLLPGGLTWGQLAGLTAAALATDGCAGWSVCIYNPDLDPGRDGADAIISYITQAITTEISQRTEGVREPPEWAAVPVGWLARADGSTCLPGPG